MRTRPIASKYVRNAAHSRFDDSEFRRSANGTRAMTTIAIVDEMCEPRRSHRLRSAKKMMNTLRSATFVVCSVAHRSGPTRRSADCVFDVPNQARVPTQSGPEGPPRSRRWVRRYSRGSPQNSLSMAAQTRKRRRLCHLLRRCCWSRRCLQLRPPARPYSQEVKDIRPTRAWRRRRQAVSNSS